MKVYDAIIIGSSPVMLLEAIYLSISGKDVLIVEQKSDIGGAWNTLVMDGNIIESGCHIWYRDRVAYDFLKNILDLNLVVMSPPPFIYYKRKKMPYTYKGIINVLQSISSLSRLKRKLGEAFGEMSTLKDFQYPKTGSVELIQKLKLLIKELSIPIKYNSKLENININNQEETEVELTNGKHLVTKEIVISSHTEFNSINKQGNIYQVRNTYLNTNHMVHIFIENNRERYVTYGHVVDNANFIRLADLSFQLGKDKKNQALYCIQVTNELYNLRDNHQEVKGRIRDELVNLQIIDKEAYIAAYHFHSYDCRMRIFEDNLELERQFAPNLRIINTINFSYSLSRQINRWIYMDNQGIVSKLIKSQKSPALY